MRFKTLISAAMALAVAACSGQGEVKAPDAVGGLTKAQVEAIVKEYLMREPMVLAEAFGELQRREEEEKMARAEAAFAQTRIAPDDIILGPANAPITIVEFTDYNCTWCRAAVPWVMKQLDNPQRDIRVVFKESAVRGASSELAAAAALASRAQGKYREMHVALMKVPPNGYTPENIEKIAKANGIDFARLKTDMNSKPIRDKVQAAVNDYDKLGLEGTPTFFINGTYLSGFGEEHLDAIVTAERDKLKKGG